MDKMLMLEKIEHSLHLKIDPERMIPKPKPLTYTEKLL
jgi:hypothetical protein